MDKLTLLNKVDHLLNYMIENYTENCLPNFLSEYTSLENKLLDFKNLLLGE